jgi:hypothetical protein
VDVVIDRISDHYSSATGSYTPYHCEMPGEATLPHFDLIDIEDFLGTSIIPMNEIFEDGFDANQFTGHLDFAMEMGDMIQGQSRLEMAPLAAAALFILGTGVATTVSEFVDTVRHVGDALENGSNNTVTTQDQKRARRRAIKATQVANEFGYGAPSTVYSAFAKYLSGECRIPDDELIKELLF